MKKKTKDRGTKESSNRYGCAEEFRFAAGRLEGSRTKECWTQPLVLQSGSECISPSKGNRHTYD